MKTMITLLSFCLMVSCTSMISSMDSKIMIGHDLKASRVKNRYFSKQPSITDYQKLKDQGFETVINLRDPSEHEESLEKTNVEKVGMKYINIPFPKDLKLTKEYVAKVHKRVKDHEDNGKILIHCSTGNRASMWLGAEFHEYEGYTEEESLKMSKQMGLNKDKAVDALRAYFAKD